MVFRNYPASHAGDYASINLAQFNKQRGDVVSALAFYKEFLALADANDQRAAAVQKKIAALEGGAE